MKLFQREPTLWIAFASSVVVLLGTFGFRLLTPDNAAAVVVVINAIAAAINAYAVRPISPIAFTYAVASVVALAATYGFNVPPETIAAINALVVPALALLSRGQVSPEETAVSNA